MLMTIDIVSINKEFVFTITTLRIIIVIMIHDYSRHDLKHIATSGQPPVYTIWPNMPMFF